MARNGHRIDRVGDREKLTPRTPPYWHRLSSGCYIGYRKSSRGGGSWLAQYYDQATQKQTRKSLGTFDTLPPTEQFDAAKREAESWFAHLGKGGTVADLTVQQACEQYVRRLQDTKGVKSSKDAESRFARWIYNDPIGRLALQRLARAHLAAWRARLGAAPVIVTPHADQPATRARAPASVNRDMTALRAALNLALGLAQVTSDLAWRVELTPIKGADKRRTLYLDRDQRRQLIAAADPDIATFLRGLATLPLRPGALAALTVAAYDSRIQVLRIGQDKTGQTRAIKLPPATAEMFKSLCRGKNHRDPIFSRADGKAWDKDAWKGPIASAALRASLPTGTTAYTLRHSTITDLVKQGLDLMTVAQISGTSVLMIQRHYAHLQADHAAAALAGLAL